MIEDKVRILDDPNAAYKDNQAKDAIKAIASILKGFIGVKTWTELEVVYNKANKADED